MRLAGPVYESLPLIYAAIGGCAALISYVEPAGLDSGITFTIALAAEIAALTLYLRRRDARELRREYRGGDLRAPTEDRRL